MSTVLIITPFYPFPRRKGLIQDSNVVYYFVANKRIVDRVIILYYYQHTKLNALKKFFKLFLPVKIDDCLFADDKGNTVLLLEHACLVPHKSKTLSLFDDKYILLLNKYLEDNNITIDSLVVHFPSRFSAFAKKIKCKKKVAIIHSFDVKNENNKRLVARYQRIYDKIGYRSVNIKMSASSFVDQQIPSFLCLSGVPDNIIDEQVVNKAWKTVRLNIITVGRLDANKNTILILQALMLIRGKFDFHLDIVGDGSLKKVLQDYVAKNDLGKYVSFCGKINRMDVFKKMEESDLFILTSKKETLGLTFLEALSKGCLVIGSRNQGIFGLFSEDDGCFFVDPNDSIELSEVLTHISMMNFKEVFEMRRNAYEKMHDLTDSKVADNYFSHII